MQFFDIKFGLSYGTPDADCSYYINTYEIPIILFGSDGRGLTVLSWKKRKLLLFQFNVIFICN